MKWYPWLNSHFKQLIKNYQKGLGHYVLLIQALPGMGDDILIYAISHFLICQNPEREKSCNQCRSCQLMTAKTHPDFYILELEKNKTNLGVDAIRNITEKIYTHAFFDGAKVIWLKNSETLTESAANALLKILEEPPKNTWFFLSCSEPKRLLMTLRSRCCLYYLQAPDETWTANWLLDRSTTTSIEEALSALRLSCGAPITALEMLEFKTWSQRKLLCKKFHIVLESKNWFIFFDVLNHEHIFTRLYWLSSLLLDAIKLQYGSTLFNNIDVYSLLDILAKRLKSIVMQAIIQEISKTYKKLLIMPTLNRELLLTNLLLNIEHLLQSSNAVLIRSNFLNI